MATITIIKALLIFAPFVLGGVFFILWKFERKKRLALMEENAKLNYRIKAFKTRQDNIIKNKNLSASQLDEDLKDYFRD